MQLARHHPSIFHAPEGRLQARKEAGQVMSRNLLILGTRGIPASHGGFETFAEGFALDMVRRGWKVAVYCQAEGEGEVAETEWNGVRLIHVPVNRGDALGTIQFDLRSVLHACRQDGVVLTLGYNTALFSVLHRLARQVNVMNMDGIEWQRDKWSPLQRTWLFCNEWLGARLASHLVADHPAIRDHLCRHTAASKITVIPYGTEVVTEAPEEHIRTLGLAPGEYALVIARPEPENSILEIVRSYASVAPSVPLVVLGHYSPAVRDYHREVLACANEHVRFLGAIYDKAVVKSLRFHARVYIHGPKVGGTNPSLIEAMATGRPVIAHDNRFNRWVLGEGGMYFSDDDSLHEALRQSLDQRIPARQVQQIAERQRVTFSPSAVHDAYEQLLLRYTGLASSKAVTTADTSL